MRLLKKEREALASLLIQGADTPEALAELVAAELDRVRGERTTFSVTFRTGQTTARFYTFGPYSTEAQAIKAWEKHPCRGLATGFAIAPTTSAEGVEQVVAKVDAPPEPKGDFAEVAKDARARRNGWKGKAVERDSHLS